jgi:hypothetical protein
MEPIFSFVRPSGEIKNDITRDLSPSTVKLIEKYNFNAHSCFLTYIGYRIWNAVKAIFGKSDWQKAVDLQTEKTKIQIKSAVPAGNDALVKRVLGSSKVEEGLKKDSERKLENVLAKLNVLNKMGDKVDLLKFREAVENIKVDEEEQIKTVLMPMIEVFKPEFNSLKQFIISTLTTLGAPKEAIDFAKGLTTQNIIKKFEEIEDLAPVMLPFLDKIMAKLGTYKDQFIDALEFDDKNVEKTVKAELKELELNELGPAFAKLKVDYNQVLQFVMKITKNEEPSKIKVLGILQSEEDSELDPEYTSDEKLVEAKF